MRTKLFFLSGTLFILLQSCVQVKEYQKQYLKDPDMGHEVSTAEQPDLNVQVYREGAGGADGSSGGGGCGCN